MSSVCFLSYLSTWATQVMFPRQLGQDNSADTQKEVNKCVKKVLTSKQWNASCFSPSFLTLPWHVIRCSTLGYSLCPTVHLIHNCWWSWLSPFEPLTSHVALSMYPPLFCVPLVKESDQETDRGNKRESENENKDREEEGQYGNSWRLQYVSHEKPWELRKLAWPILNEELWAYQWLWDEMRDAPRCSNWWSRGRPVAAKVKTGREKNGTKGLSKQNGCEKEHLFQGQLISGFSKRWAVKSDSILFVLWMDISL